MSLTTRNFFMRAQVAEASTEKKRTTKQFPSLTANSRDKDNTSPAVICVSCGKEKHPLYMCNKFGSLPHGNKMELVRAKGYCFNCLHPGHFTNKCKSMNHCK